MVNEMLQLLRKRTHFHHYQEKLQQLMESGEVSEEQYGALSAKYAREQHEIDAEIAVLKGRAQETLDGLRATMAAYDDQLAALQRELSEGRISSRLFQKRVEKVQAERAACPAQEEIPILEAVVRANSTVDLAGLEEEPLAFDASPGRNEAASQHGTRFDTGLRIAAFFVGLVVLISVFLPFFPNNIQPEPVSAGTLFAFSMANLSDSGFPLLFAGIPAAFGLLVLLTSAVGNRLLRGWILLAEGSAGMMFLAVAAAFVLYFPWPGIGINNVLRWWVPYPPLGMSLLLLAFLAVPFLALIHVLNSRTGVVVWILSFLFVVLTGTVSGAAFRFGAHAAASASLKTSEIVAALKTEQMDKPAEALLEAEVSNNGNVPLFLREKLPAEAVRSEYEFGLEAKLPGKEWMPVEERFDCTKVVSVNASEVVKAKVVLPKDGSPVVFRVRLTGTDGVGHFSNEITVEPPRTGSGPLPSAVAAAPPVPVPGVEASGASGNALEEKARDLVDTVKTKLVTELPAKLLTQIQEARNAIDRLPEDARLVLDEQLDEAILSAKDKHAEELLKKAEEAMQAGTFPAAIASSQELLNSYDEEPLARVVPLSYDAQGMMDGAQQIFDQASLAGDPSVRFRVTGFMETGPMGPTAFLVDNLTGQTFRVQQGAVVGEWSVSEMHNRRVVLKKGDQTWEVR